MKVLCPNCQHSVTISANDATMRCEACQFETTISRINTTPGTTQSVVVADLSGQMVGGRYLLDSYLGMGGMGVVYRAVDTETDGVVAVKILSAVPATRGHGQEGPDNKDAKDGENEARANPFVQRFQREVTALKRLNHPNIVRLLDAGDDGPLHYLVTEFIEGEDLSRYLKSHPMPVTQALSILRDVCEALAYAHEQGVIHRDIKPANILVSENGARVLDFGLARVAQPDLSCTTLTRTDIAMGTFNYLSPEQRMNAKEVDGRTDIFSLGVVGYEMLTGGLPVGNFDSPREHSAAVSPALDALVMRCLQNNPDRRYASAGELGAAVTRIQQPPSRRKYLHWRIAAGLLLGGAMAAWTLWPANTGEIDNEKPDQRMQPSPSVPREVLESVRRGSPGTDTRRMLPEKVLFTPPALITTDTAPKQASPDTEREGKVARARATQSAPERKQGDAAPKKFTPKKPLAGSAEKETKVKVVTPPQEKKKISRKPTKDDFDRLTGK